MGVVIRQSLKYSAVSYVFMIASILATLLIYHWDLELYGTLIFFIDTGGLFLPLILFGSTGVALKFFPEIKSKAGNGRIILNAGIFAIGITSLILILVSVFFKKTLDEYVRNSFDNIEIINNIWLIIPIIVLLAIQNYLSTYTANFRRTAFPKLLHNVIRITLPLVFLGIYFEYISVRIGLYVMCGNYALSALILLFYLNGLEKLKFRITKDVVQFVRRKDVIAFATFGILASLGSNLSFKLDTFVTTLMLDSYQTGLYGLSARIGAIISVPSAAILAIAAPIIADATKNKQLGRINDLYKRSSEVLTLIGALLLGGLCVIGHDLILLMNDGANLLSMGALPVLFFIALAKFVDMITSINSAIIQYSSYYKYNLYFLLSLAVTNVVLNIVLIPILGVTGVAVATFTSLSLFNLVKIVFIKLKFGIQPFSATTLQIIFIGVFCVLCTFGINEFFEINGIVGILLKSVIVCSLFLGITYFLKVSEDYTKFLDKVLARALKLISR